MWKPFERLLYAARAWALIAALIGAVSVPMAPLHAGGGALRVEATGHAFVASPADRDAARRRAIGEALISAALSGGATLRGHTVLDKGRITADLAILRPTGRILSHELLSAELYGAEWRVRVAAIVGHAPEGPCAARRRLTVSATPPDITVAPDAPAWAAPLARRLALDVAQALRSHPGTTLDSVAPNPDRPVAAALDYTALTRGTSAPRPGDHQLQQRIAVTAEPGTVHLALDIAFLGPDGRLVRRSIARVAKAPKGGTAGYLTGASRSAAEAALSAGVIDDLRGHLSDLSCRAPAARLAVSAGRIEVPIGTQHGLTRASLAFVDDQGDGFGLLEIVALHGRSAVLRPLDPTRGTAEFDGARVYFLEAGL